MEELIITKIGQMMTSPVKIVGTDVPLVEAAKMMTEAKVGSLVVEIAKGSWGMITEKDMVRVVTRGGAVVDASRVKDYMTSPIIWGDPEMTLVEASVLMHKEGIRRLPVIRDGQLVGIVTETDLNRMLRESTIGEMEKKLEELKAFERGALEKVMPRVGVGQGKGA